MEDAAGERGALAYFFSSLNGDGGCRAIRRDEILFFDLRGDDAHIFGFGGLEICINILDSILPKHKLWTEFSIDSGSNATFEVDFSHRCLPSVGEGG